MGRFHTFDWLTQDSKTACTGWVGAIDIKKYLVVSYFMGVNGERAHSHRQDAIKRDISNFKTQIY